MKTLFISKIYKAQGQILITERSIYDNFFIFEEALFKEGHITETEYYTNLYILNVVHEMMLKNFNIINIQLNTSEEVSYEQMKQRGNINEINNYTPEYLHSVAENHKIMIEKMSGKMQIFNDNFDNCYAFLTKLIEENIVAIRN